MADPVAGGEPDPAGSRIGVLVSGGAPNLHLVAGALYAFDEHNIAFDMIGASGAGALAGLLYAVPKHPGGRAAALRQTVNLNVSDAIYNLLPMNYKAFFKHGAFAAPFWRFGQSIPHQPLDPNQQHRDTFARLYNDSIDFMIAALTPTTLNYFSKSVCTRVDVINDWIDWAKLKDYDKEFYVNAFDLNTQQLRLFDKKNLTSEAFWAALAMPWLFEPTAATGGTYTEGASHDPSGLEALIESATADAAGLDKIITLDTVGPDLWTNPTNIYEALQLAIMDPIVSLAETVLATYGRVEYSANGGGQQRLPKLYRLPFLIPSWETPHILEWSYSNALTLWHAGYSSAETFIKALGKPAELETYRYHDHKRRESPRTVDFLDMFDDIVDASVRRFPPGSTAS